MKNIYCNDCEINLTNDEIALNLKLSGKSTYEFLCIDCMSKIMETTSNELLLLKNHIKDMGCSYFKQTYI